MITFQKRTRFAVKENAFSMMGHHGDEPSSGFVHTDFLTYASAPDESRVGSMGCGGGKQAPAKYEEAPEKETAPAEAPKAEPEPAPEPKPAEAETSKPKPAAATSPPPSSLSNFNRSSPPRK